MEITVVQHKGLVATCTKTENGFKCQVRNNNTGEEAHQRAVVKTQARAIENCLSFKILSWQTTRGKIRKQSLRGVVEKRIDQEDMGRQ